MGLSVITKVTSAGCNIRCKYCFYSGLQGKIQVMDLAVLNQIYEKCCAVAENLTIIWHGGEPLVAGRSFFEEAIQLQEPYIEDGVKIENRLQTNGTLVDQAWVDFFKRHDFRVGVSLDGPDFIHDRVRVDAAGKGTHSRVMRAINLLRDNGFKISVIAVATPHSLPHADKIYEFFRGEEIPFSPNPCVDEGRSSEWEVDPIEYAHFICHIFDRWFSDDDPKFRIRQFVEIIRGFLGQQPGLCTYMGTCHRFIAVDVNGDVYPCDKFAHTGYQLGNLTQQSLDDLQNSKFFGEFYGQRATVLEECAGCEWLAICRGGCMREWELGQNPISRGTSYCQARQIIFSHIHKRLVDAGHLEPQ